MNKAAHVHAQAELFGSVPFPEDAPNPKSTIGSPGQRSGNQTEFLTLSAMASTLGVSTATIRNWVKAGLLTPLARRPL